MFDIISNQGSATASVVLLNVLCAFRKFRKWILQLFIKYTIYIYKKMMIVANLSIFPDH